MSCRHGDCCPYEDSELEDAILAAQDFREERDEALAEISRLHARIAELEKKLKGNGAASKQKKRNKKTAYDFERRRRIACAADLIHGAFTWSETIQGHEFWSERYEALNAMAEGAESNNYHDTPSRALCGAFGWDGSPQGDAFWREAYDILEEMGK